MASLTSFLALLGILWRNRHVFGEGGAGSRIIHEFSEFGGMMTPALAVDGRLKSAGKALFPADIKKILLESQ